MLLECLRHSPLTGDMPARWFTRAGRVHLTVQDKRRESLDVPTGYFRKVEGMGVLFLPGLFFLSR